MSLNKYDPLTGTLTTLANGQRIWLGTKAAHDAAEAAGTLPTNCLIAITDDGDITGVVDAVENGNMNPVTSNAVYDKLTETGLFDKSYLPYVCSYDLYKETTLQTTSGFLKITMPFGKFNIMTKFTVDIYQYATSIAQYQVGFYAYNTGSSSTPSWNIIQPAASCYGHSFKEASSSSTDVFIDDLPVTIGFDNSDADHICIWIGKTDGATRWSYPHIVIKDAIAGFPLYDASYIKGTTIEFVSSIDGFHTKTVTL